MSRKLTIGTDTYTTVVATDERGPGNANHEYEIYYLTGEPPCKRHCCQKVSFQNGPIKEVGINGVANEDLLAIVADRLSGFQGGDYACEENKLALGYILKAMGCLRMRTEVRISRQIEGTSKI